MTSVAELIQTARLSAELTQSELAERAELSQPAVARYEGGVTLPTLPTLERLLAACGRSLELRAVDPSGARASASTIRGRLGARAALLRRSRPALLKLAESRGVSRIRVFGSTARGDDTPESDIDLLVELHPDRTLLDLTAFGREASGLLGIAVDVATTDMLKPQVRPEVERTAVLL